MQEATLELAGQKDEAERANTAKSRFLAAASHDLRQPLHALSLFSADLQRQVRSGTAQELPAWPSKSPPRPACSANCSTPCSTFRASMSPDQAGEPPDATATDIPAPGRLLPPCRADRKMTLRFRPSAHWVETDPVMLERMIANLVSNALRYTPPGGWLVAARRRGGRSPSRYATTVSASPRSTRRRSLPSSTRSATRRANRTRAWASAVHRRSPGQGARHPGQPEIAAGRRHPVHAAAHLSARPQPAPAPAPLQHQPARWTASATRATCKPVPNCSERWDYEVRVKASGDTGRTSRHAVVIADPDALRHVRRPHATDAGDRPGPRGNGSICPRACTSCHYRCARQNCGRWSASFRRRFRNRCRSGQRQPVPGSGC